MIVELPQNRIDFEDTIVLLDESGQFVSFGKDEKGNDIYTKYINSFEAYDDIKALLRRNPGYRAYSHTGYGKNLKGTNTWFTINDREYNIYDLDSVRSSQYLWKVLNAKNFEAALNSIPAERLTTIQRTLGWRFDYDFLKANPKSAKEIIGNLIKRCNWKTQEILKAIENGESFEASEEFGIVNPTISEDGTPIQYSSIHEELKNLGTKKTVDAESTIAALENPAIASENPVVAKWVISLLENPANIENIPQVGLSDSIKAYAERVRELKTQVDRMRTTDPEFIK